MKVLANDIAIVESDTHIGRWVQDCGVLAHDGTVNGYIGPHIPEGGWVVEAGANIGTHTIVYADRVGSRGRVIAFEPHPDSFACLQYNMRNYPWVECRTEALADVERTASMLCDDGNIGASYLDVRRAGVVSCRALDAFGITRLDLLKMDIEGMEWHALRGARETIMRCRPTIVLEMNSGALGRNGITYNHIHTLLTELRYNWGPLIPGGDAFELQYDLLCKPA